jgi:pyruvate/2-oxoglutarate dehydrogenase complex dihydrolipoamide dehydrogenase (E3) component
VENRNEVGGQLTLAAKPPGKSEIGRFLTYLKNSLKAQGIQVELGVKINEAWLDQFKPDVAILATGSDPAIPSIEGLSTENTLSGRDVLSEAEISGVRIMTKTSVLSLTAEGVLVECKGSREILRADTVVTATGANPHKEDMDRMIRKKVPEVHVIGDRRKARGILDAVREGYDTAKGI